MELQKIIDEYNALLNDSRKIRFPAGAQPTSSDMWNMAVLIALDKKNSKPIEGPC